MVDKRTIKMQLASIDTELPFWVHAEVRELPRIIVEGEMIQGLVSGRYEGGFALLCTTSHRILIIDKKPLFLTVEDIRYDMISEVNYSHQLFDSSIHFSSFSKDLWFTSFKKQQLRRLTDFIQHKMSELRENHTNDVRPHDSFLTAQQMSGDQARELLPGTQQAWDRISDKLERINTYQSRSALMRRRVAKFDTFQ